MFKGSDVLCARRNLFCWGLGWLKPRIELPRCVSVNSSHREYENRTLKFSLGHAMDFLTSARQWLRVVGMNDRGVILLKGDSDEDL